MSDTSSSKFVHDIVVFLHLLSPIIEVPQCLHRLSLASVIYCSVKYDKITVFMFSMLPLCIANNIYATSG